MSYVIQVHRIVGFHGFSSNTHRGRYLHAGLIPHLLRENVPLVTTSKSLMLTHPSTSNTHVTIVFCLAAVVYLSSGKVVCSDVTMTEARTDCTLLETRDCLR